MMPVFISHKDVDSDAALKIRSHLESKKIRCYVDVLDEKISTTEDITNRITEVIGRCTHLIAVMSNATEKSWWVPFEVGEATFGFRRIASYDLGSNYGFPDYLKKWPVMKTPTHLDMFASSYHADADRVKDLNKSAAEMPFTTRIQVDEFHKNLKTKIARGY